MATKKYITKQLRAMAMDIPAQIIEKGKIVRLRRIGASYSAEKKRGDIVSNPYRRLKRSYKRGEVSLQLISRSGMKEINS